MARILATLLLLTTFVSNTAWAFDVHFDDLSSGSVTMTGVNEDGTGDDGPACANHCHHSTAHLLGLHLDSDEKHPPSLRYVTSVYLDRLTTRFPALPSEPPRA